MTVFKIFDRMSRFLDLTIRKKVIVLSKSCLSESQLVMDWVGNGNQKCTDFFSSSSRMFVIEGKEGRDEMEIVQKAQDKNLNFSCGQVFSKYGVNKIYMWVERKKLVEK